ncbi:MAG: endonuclease III [Nanoarchaeota archaeon]
MISSQKALRQFHAIEKLAGKLRLAADEWDEDWKTLIATLMSARTTDAKTIPTAEGLFKKYNTLEKLSKASYDDIAKIIRSVNFYKNKTRYIMKLSKKLIEEYDGNVPHVFEELIELPGVGRKTANVFLAENGHGRIGVDTHVNWISKKMGWTKSDKQAEVERDLENLFPKKLWGKLNWVLVRFGQTYKSRKEKNRILDGIKKII